MVNLLLEGKVSAKEMLVLVSERKGGIVCVGKAAFVRVWQAALVGVTKVFLVPYGRLH